MNIFYSYNWKITEHSENKNNEEMLLSTSHKGEPMNIIVGSRDLQRLCDININDKSVFSLNVDKIKDITDNCTLYVSNCTIHIFSRIINAIPNKFILVSGGDDVETYRNTFNNNYESFINFIENEKIIHWFCQNCTIDHPKITKMPIT